MRYQSRCLHTLKLMPLRHYALLIFSALLLMEDGARAESAVDFFNMLSPEVDGWKKAGPPEIYDRKTLFKYIDGGAELYISYSFEKLTAFRYVRGKDEEIKVDVFDMGNSYNAYGVFSLSRESLSQEIGQDSEYSSGLLNFWKDRYYVSLFGYPETPEKHQVLLKLGREISGLIPREGPLPQILSSLPTDGLISESIRYVHHHVWLNSNYFISNDNILLIDAKTEAALAAYRSAGGRYFLMLIKYPSRQKAQAAEASFLKQYLAGAVSGIKRFENGRFSGIKRNGTCLAVVLNAADKKTVVEVLAQTIKQQKQQQ
jgi:hypothetical protein